MKKIFQQKHKGFTLIETLIAISIFTVSILALMSVLGQGISNTNYAKQKIIASYLAQEGIEYMRNMRDNDVLYTQITGKNWGSFKSKLAPCNSGN
ncbi:MAG: prepilin-type N-terminal cleavage/methylation domain-containing protein, partial [Patescibacteria group bacterium]